MNFNSIRVRYTAIFFTIALFFIISVMMNFSLINRTNSGMDMFSKQFNPAISAVLNADRDLYQARVAELQALSSQINSRELSTLKADFEENAQQAYDRMQKYKELLSQYPDILAKLNDFQVHFKQWKNNASNVFELVNNNNIAMARVQSSGDSLDSFNRLREFYDVAGESADKKSLTLSNQIHKSVSNSQSILSVISFVIIIAAIAIGFIAPKAMSNALILLSEQLKALNSGDGDLTKRINSTRQDEIGQIANNLDQLIAGLAELISSIIGQSSKVIAGVHELDSGASHIKHTSQHQTDKVDMVVTAVNEMSYAIKQVAEHANETSNDIEEVNRLTSEGSNITEQTVRQMSELSSTVNHASEVILRLSENSSDIASVLDVIRGIAEQTNLLALNAAIEAARAGEQGRGFAVVADEVRTLASRTQESTQSIQEMIEALQKGVEQAVNSINKGSEATEQSVILSQQTLESLNKISEASIRVSDVASQTATATEEQSQVISDISQNLTELADETKDNFNVAQSNQQQAAQTMELATHLSDSVTRFKLD